MGRRETAGILCTCGIAAMIGATALPAHSPYFDALMYGGGAGVLIGVIWLAYLFIARPRIWLEFEPAKPLIQQQNEKNWRLAVRVRTAGGAFRDVRAVIVSIRLWERHADGRYDWGEELALGHPMQIGWSGNHFNGQNVNDEALLILLHYQLELDQLKDSVRGDGWVGKFFIEPRRLPVFDPIRRAIPLAKFKIVIELQSGNDGKFPRQAMILDWFGDIKRAHLTLLKKRGFFK